ncbi:GGDEF domain-containing protein [Amycolatopsis taiwanensis]|uniref:GGDEF domain-containing protein n=1 Tax=Amycolatopsis taiwanensis TaxID=342230 RepID=A0A9W6QV25_9PSEU|nr:GGDEF domain-containing protein [Amycolatopsis taiwanensis]
MQGDRTRSELGRAPSATGAGPAAPGGNGAGTLRHPKWHPRQWALWRRPKRFIGYLLLSEMAAITAIGLTITANAKMPQTHDWVGLAILAAGATVHIQLTRRQEERRRNRTRTVLIDLTAVWTFPAAIILPVTLSVLLVLLLRIQHWFIARRPPHNFVFSSISHGLSVALTSVTFTALGGQHWGAGGLGSLREFGIVVVAGLVFEAVQVVYVGGILALSTPGRPTIHNVLGSKADNLLEAITIGLGAVTAVLLVVLPPAVAIMAVVTVVFNRLAELDQLQDDVRTDPKTQVFNMRGWTESAERALARTVKASGQRLAVLMIDLDHFKWINDTYGHPAGDDVLHNLAQLLNDVTRPSDVVGRFGGEEFLVLLADTDHAGATGTGERIRSAVAGLRITTTDKRGELTTIVNRTASVGVAVYPEHGTSLESLMQAADAAVYEAKEGGRNQVRVAGGRRAGSGGPAPAAQPDHLTR